MAFTEAQVRALNRNLSAGKIRTRRENGRDFSYIEGWHAIAEANRIFGFDSWDRETVDAKCVLTREVRGQTTVVYLAKVRLSVRAGDRLVVREGHGTGEGRGTSPGEAHDLGLKAAETDATKRALATFGKPFGLALYSSNGRKDKADASGPSPSASSATLPVTLHDWPAPRDQDAAVNGPNEVCAANGARLGRSDHPATHSQSSRSTESSGVDKSALTYSEPRRLRDKQHLRFVALQPCLACGRRPADPHHLRFAQPRALGLKPSDEFTVPLCREHHRELHHSGNEAAWWHEMGLDPLPTARELWDRSHKRHRHHSSPERGPLDPSVNAT
jgi:hypothetical protein